MNLESRIDQLVERLCLHLGRYGWWHDILDRISRFVVPEAVLPVLRPAATAGGYEFPVIYMQTIQEQRRTATDHGNAPDIPDKDQKSVHSTAECSDMMYHGMHGTPCKYNGGTDKTCPPGTEPGWFWSFTVKGIGKVYYVDCCGGPDHSSASSVKVWCGWSTEVNWCGGRGKDIYTCTLAIQGTDFVQDSEGLAEPLRYKAPAPPPSAAGTAAAIAKINDILDSWWISDADIKEILSILAKVKTAADMRTIRNAVTPNITEISDLGDRAKVRLALGRL